MLSCQLSCILNPLPLSAGMLSHQLKQHVIDGEKSIIQNPTELQRFVGPCLNLFSNRYGLHSVIFLTYAVT